MTTQLESLNSTISDFAQQVKEAAAPTFRVLRQQWTMSGLLEEATAKHLLPATDL